MTAILKKRKKSTQTNSVERGTLNQSNQQLHVTKEVFLTKHDGKLNFEALQNSELPIEFEVSLRSQLVVSRCPIYTAEEIFE
jgi:hypothetical protein